MNTDMIQQLISGITNSNSNPYLQPQRIHNPNEIKFTPKKIAKIKLNQDVQQNLEERKRRTFSRNLKKEGIFKMEDNFLKKSQTQRGNLRGANVRNK